MSSAVDDPEGMGTVFPDRTYTRRPDHHCGDDMMADNAHADVKRLSFERAIEELETIVTRLEGGKVPLE